MRKLIFANAVLVLFLSLNSSQIVYAEDQSFILENILIHDGRLMVNPDTTNPIVRGNNIYILPPNNGGLLVFKANCSIGQNMGNDSLYCEMLLPNFTITEGGSSVPDNNLIQNGQIRLD